MTGGNPLGTVAAGGRGQGSQGWSWETKNLNYKANGMNQVCRCRDPSPHQRGVGGVKPASFSWCLRLQGKDRVNQTSDRRSMDIQLTVTILLIYTKCLNNTLSSSEETLIQCLLPAVGTVSTNAERPLDQCPSPGWARGLR